MEENNSTPNSDESADQEEIMRLWREQYGNMVPEKIVDTKIGEDGRRYYKVQWAASTMEPAKNFLEAEQLIQKYWDPVQKKLTVPSKRAKRALDSNEAGSSQSCSSSSCTSSEEFKSKKDVKQSKNGAAHCENDVARCENDVARSSHQETSKNSEMTKNNEIKSVRVISEHECEEIVENVDAGPSTNNIGAKECIREEKIESCNDEKARIEQDVNKTQPVKNVMEGGKRKYSENSTENCKEPLSKRSKEDS